MTRLREQGQAMRADAHHDQQDDVGESEQQRCSKHADGGAVIVRMSRHQGKSIPIADQEESDGSV